MSLGGALWGFSIASSCRFQFEKYFSALSIEGDLEGVSAVARRLNNTSVIGDGRF
jgi:hypothetical protein